MARLPAILFIHDNFPAQFGAIGLWLSRQGWDVAFASAAARPRLAGVRWIGYAPHRAPAPQTHPYAQPMERAVIAGQAFARAALTERANGFAPDIIVAHSGWGSGLFARDVFPRAAFAAYCEWWYRSPGPDVAWLAAAAGQPVPGSVEGAISERIRNAPIALDIAGADAVLSPTQFQADQFPAEIRSRIIVGHDGIDTDRYAPHPAGRTGTLGGLIAADARLVTYATRGMEPHRGFPQFMAALPEVFSRDPRAVAVIAGENRVVYGGNRLRAVDWKERALAEHDIDPARVHFVGHLGGADYLRLLRRSDAHVYLTVPFVLSWSMLEAMSCGCPMIVSDTAPVREFADADTAAIVDMTSPAAIAAAVVDTLAGGEAVAARAARARQSVQDRAARETCFDARRTLFRRLCAG